MCVMVVSATEKSCSALEKLLCELKIEGVTVCSSISIAKSMLKSTKAACVIINPPFPEEKGLDFAVWTAKNTLAGVIFLSPSSCADQIGEELLPLGVAVIEKPLKRDVLEQAVHFSLITNARLSGVSRENLRLKTLVGDIKMIDRAKCVLIQYLGMTESQAHHYIEKLAMDSQRSKADVAQSIIATYES